MPTVRASLAPADRFVTRHIGPSPDETRGMLATLGYESLDAFIDAVVPEDLRARRPLALPPGRTEREVLQALRGLAAQNQLYRSYIGMGYPLLHAPGHPAQHRREPGVVHGVHTVPAGDRAGPARGAAQLPDDGRRPHRPADRQRLPAR